MHPDLARLLGRFHQDELLDEAARERLAVIARGRRSGRERTGITPAWRRALGWAVIELGIRVAGGPIAPAMEHR